MQTELKQTVQVTLVMSDDEARWLKGVMQNPLYGQPPHEESTEDRAMRQLFFEAIPQHL